MKIDQTAWRQYLTAVFLWRTIVVPWKSIPSMSLITPLSFEFGDVRMVKVTLTGSWMSYASSLGRLWSTHQARQISTKAITISRLPILNEARFVSFLNGFSSSKVSISIAPWIPSSDKKYLKQDSQGEVTQIVYRQSQRAGVCLCSDYRGEFVASGESAKRTPSNATSDKPR